jgi:AbrB family looped-hinge helix DNA binding protein
MHTVTPSPDFEIEIPKELREKLALKPGEQLHIYEFDGVIRISRRRSIKRLRGMVKGMPWDDYRDREDRF